MNNINTIFKYIITPLMFLVAALFLFWLVNTAATYYNLQMHYKNNTSSRTLWQVGELEFFQLVHKFQFLKEKSDYTILIDIQNLNELDKEVRTIGESMYKKAILIDNMDSVAYKGKAKYRGDNVYHWLFDRKSWRFKTSKKSLIKGIRKLNFIVPKGNEILNNHLSSVLAKHIGLLAPLTDIVSVSINDQYNGLKVLTEQIDESFLRNNKRMPNDIYVGDNVSAKSYVGIPGNLLSGAHLWEKASYNNHYKKDNMFPMKKFIADIHASRFDHISLTDFAKFSILLSMTGSLHVDNTHNWKIYYDSYYEKFYPIVWDLVGWYKTHRNKIDASDSIKITDDIMKALLLNPEFLYVRQKEFINIFKNNKTFIEILNSEVNKVLDKISYMTYSTSIHYNSMNISETRQEILHLQKHIVEWLNTLKTDVFTRGNYQWMYDGDSIRLKVGGRGIVNGIYIDYKGGIDENAKSYLNFHTKNDAHKIDITDRVSISGNKIHINLPLMANSYITNNGLVKFKDSTFDFTLLNLDKSMIRSVQFELLDLDKSIINVTQENVVKRTPVNIAYENFIANNINNEVVWSNDKFFTGFNEIRDDIVINKGTKIILDDQATVVVYGKITALGTEDEPIIFESKNKSTPWGSFVIKDTAANGSLFSHCKFSGGSGSKGSMHEYTAMLSIHNVQNVVFDNCVFKDSQITDDMVHTVYSDVEFKSTKFINSLSDALDADISTVILNRCEFIDSGNDAVDLMTSNAVVVNSRLVNSSDKGISIGEGSNLVAINNFIDSNSIGMQSKDTSKAFIYNSNFISNKKAVDAYHKNWRYAKGGSIYIDKSNFNDNGITATVGKRSKVVINDSDINGNAKFNNNDLLKNKIVISAEKLIKSDLKDLFFDKYYPLVRSDVKGNYD